MVDTPKQGWDPFGSSYGVNCQYLAGFAGGVCGQKINGAGAVGEHQPLLVGQGQNAADTRVAQAIVAGKEPGFRRGFVVPKETVAGGGIHVLVHNSYGLGRAVAKVGLPGAGLSAAVSSEQ